jgi:hypothetical protein
MLFDLTIPCYLKTFSGKKRPSGKVICAFFCPAYRSSPVIKALRRLRRAPKESTLRAPSTVDSPQSGFRVTFSQCDGFFAATDALSYKQAPFLIPKNAFN